MCLRLGLDGIYALGVVSILLGLLDGLLGSLERKGKGGGEEGNVNGKDDNFVDHWRSLLWIT